jgi:putative tryptophan/tyrosine transport system substrate-binding protein
MAATTTIPIVFLTPGDPVVQKFVPRLNRPGGNVTRGSFFNATLGAKRLELLREMVPKATTLALLVSNATAEDALRDSLAATQALGLRLQILQATNESEIDGAFASLAQQRPDAPIVHPDTRCNVQIAQQGAGGNII